MIGQSAAMQRLFDLITGGSSRCHLVMRVIPHGQGAGRDLASPLSPRSPHALLRSIAARSPKPARKRVVGHEKGRSPARIADDRQIRTRHHGTLFLDEIADLSPHAQVALLRCCNSGKSPASVGESRSRRYENNIGLQPNLAERSPAATFGRIYIIAQRNDIERFLTQEPLDDIPLLAVATVKRLCVQWNLPKKRLSASLWATCPAFWREMSRTSAGAWSGFVLEDGAVIEGRHFTTSQAARNDQWRDRDMASRTRRERANKRWIERMEQSRRQRHSA